MQEYQAQVAAKKYLAPDVVELTVKLVKPRAITFQAGQFVFFNVGGAFKAYSITSSPLNKHQLMFLIKLEPGGVGSIFVKNLKLAERLEFTGPEGNFIIKTRAQNICCLAAGIGIAPFVSIIPHKLSKNLPGKLTLIYCAKTEKDIFYHKEFTKLARGHQNFQFLALPGRRLNEYLEKNYENLNNWNFYICGKPAAVNDAQYLLEKKGCEQERIYIESFLA